MKSIRIILSLLLMLNLLACSSVKKNKSKSESSSEVSIFSHSTGSVKAITETQKSKDSAATSSVEKIAETEKSNISSEQISNLEFEAKVSNGEQVSIEEYDADGNLIKKVVVSGSGEVKASSSSSKKETASEEKSTTSEKENLDVVVNEDFFQKKDSTAEASEKLNIDAKASEEILNQDLERKGFSFWSLIPYALPIIILLALYLLNKRFNWFGRLLILIKRRNEDK